MFAIFILNSIIDSAIKLIYCVYRNKIYIRELFYNVRNYFNYFIVKYIICNFCILNINNFLTLISNSISIVNYFNNINFILF